MNDVIVKELMKTERLIGIGIGVISTFLFFAVLFFILYFTGLIPVCL